METFCSVGSVLEVLAADPSHFFLEAKQLSSAGAIWLGQIGGESLAGREVDHQFQPADSVHFRLQTGLSSYIC